MIEINYTRGKNLLAVTCKGHAHSDEPGKDLVCAAASILNYTLAENVLGLCQNKRQVRTPVTELKEGDAVISCRPVHGYEYVAAVVFDSVCAGFAILAEEYPEYVSYHVKLT